MARDLRQRVILITGASSGIGAAVARACATAGMRVVLTARRLERLEAVAQEITSAGGQALPLVCDVRQDDDVQRAVARTVDHFGALHAVYANAGYGIYGSIMDTPEAQHRDLMETNYYGTLRTLRAALPALETTAPRQGHMIVCASACSEIALPMYGHYAASKAAQDLLAGALRIELEERGIAVSTVHPIGVRTEFFAVAAQTAGRQDIGYNTPAYLMHSPRRVARAILRCLRRPCPEVWPSVAARFGVALTTAFPRLAVWSLRNMVAKRYQK